MIILTFIYVAATICIKRQLEAVTSMSRSDHIHEPTVAPDSSRTCATGSANLRFSSDEAQRLSDLSKALSHPVRVQIIDILNRSESAVCVCEFERHFDLTQPTISHHLKKLRDAGLVQTEQHGLWVHYSLVPGALEPLHRLLSDLD
jgi:ArsR family transcriptional regulator